MAKKRSLSTLSITFCVICDKIKEKIDCKLVVGSDVNILITDDLVAERGFYYMCQTCCKKFRIRKNSVDELLEKISRLGHVPRIKIRR